MRRLALALSTLLLIIAGLSVVLVSASSGRPRPVVRPPTAALPTPLMPATAPKPLRRKPAPTAEAVPAMPLLPLSVNPRRLVRPRALPKGVRPLVVPNGACYVGLPQCSIHGCAQYVAPVAQPPVSAPAMESVLPAVAVAPRPAVRPRSTHCIASPARKTVSASAPIITASPAEPAVTTPPPAKP